MHIFYVCKHIQEKLTQRPLPLPTLTAFSALLQLTTASLLFYDPQITTREALSQRISAPTSRIHAALLLPQHYYSITTALPQL